MFKSSRNTTDGNIQEAVKKSLDFETTLVDIREKSEKRARVVADISTFFSLCLLGELFYILPLKEKEPYLVMADIYMRQATAAKLAGGWDNLDTTKNEAVNKSNISHFIIAGKSFGSQIIYDSNWATVYSMLTAGVSDSYRNLMNKSNPNNPFNLYGSAQSIRVKILSIVLNNSGKTGDRDASATARFQRLLLNKSTGISRFIDSNVATLTYTHNSSLKMDEKYRSKNPLGFQVLSYRADPDASESPIQDLPSDYLSAGAPSENRTQQQIQSIPQPQSETPTSIDNDVSNASPISVENGNQ